MQVNKEKGNEKGSLSRKTKRSKSEKLANGKC